MIIVLFATELRPDLTFRTSACSFLSLLDTEHKPGCQGGGFPPTSVSPLTKLEPPTATRYPRLL